MIPEFRFDEWGDWEVSISASPEEIELLRTDERFDHRIVLHRKWKEKEPDIWSEDYREVVVQKEETTQLRDFGPDICCRYSFPSDNPIEIEGWEAEITKRLKVLTEEMATMIEPSPPDVPDTAWQAHSVFMSPSGSGKSNNLRWRLLPILDEIGAGRATGVVMEPKGTLIGSILSLRLTYEMRERVALIDPEDSTAPVAINIFDRGDGGDRDRNSSLAMAKYVLDTLAMTLTPNHRQILQALTQLMFVLPEQAWMGTLMDALRYGAKKHQEHFHKLTRATREFFELQFDNEKGQLVNRKGELINRLNDMLGQPTFDRLLYQKKTTFDLTAKMNEGSLILINANEGYLGFGEATKLYGKFWTAQLYKAGMARYDMLKRGQTLKPCWVFIDEAQQYVTDDEMFSSSLNLLREAKISMCFAMHYLSQIEKLSVRDAISTNTAVKFSAIPETDYHFGCEAPKLKSVVKFLETDYRKLPQATTEEIEEIRELSRSKFGSVAPIDITAEADQRQDHDQRQDQPDDQQPDDQPGQQAAPRRRRMGRDF